MSKFRKILRGLLPPPNGFSSAANSLEWKIKIFWNKGTVLEWFLYCLITLRKSIFGILLVISTEGINFFFLLWLSVRYLRKKETEIFHLVRCGQVCSDVLIDNTLLRNIFKKYPKAFYVYNSEIFQAQFN